MVNNSCLTLFLALFFYLCVTIFATVSPQEVHIISAMDDNALPININCKVQEGLRISRQLRAREVFEFNVNENDVYFCMAVGGKELADWHGFEPARDSGHLDIFWKLNKDGVFLSYDKSKWDKKADWETE